MKVVCALVAPSALEASRRSAGTAMTASWVVLMTTGRVMIPSVRHPATRLYPVAPMTGPRVVTNTTMPNRPKTTDGVPLRTSTAVVIADVIFPRPAYSAR